MACCCNGCSPKSASICLGRCLITKHKCLQREDIKPGPVPKHMGWLYTARDSPEHQLRCGWRPGHISNTVLKRMAQYNCVRAGECNTCSKRCNRPPHPSTPCCVTSKCLSVCPSIPSCSMPCSTPCKPSNPCAPQSPLIRIIRHGGQYTICTKPSNMNNSPAGPFPLKYVLDTDDCPDPKNCKFSIEAKYNDYVFNYTSSQTSFVLDFSPPDAKCGAKPCPKRCF